jgi:SAM-dependent methyltransferase
MNNILSQLFSKQIFLKDNIISFEENEIVKEANQDQTSNIFSDKWLEAAEYESIDKMYEFQLQWFLKLYGFETKENLTAYLADKKTIIDTGCGLGYKAAWFATLAPHATVLGVDISDAMNVAAKNYRHIPNLFFFKADIADTGLKNNVIDFTVCDQVIMHTEVPEKTFKHLSDITSKAGEFACYVYSKKALPRELVDDYFRKATHDIPNDKMWEFSEQLTVLGKRLSDLQVSFECPEIPVLGIKAGTYDIQRFIYWNFLKCFWKEDWGFDLSKSTNYDWYAPSNAKRFTKEEFLEMGKENHLDISFFHQEEACHTARFYKP